MANNDTPWAERWPKPEFNQQGWEEVMSELSNMAGEIAQNTPKVTKEDLERAAQLLSKENGGNRMITRLVMQGTTVE